MPFNSIIFGRSQLSCVFAHLTNGEQIQRLPLNTVVLERSCRMSPEIIFEKSWERNLFLGSVESSTP